MLGSVRPRVPRSSRNGAAANSNLPLAQPRLGSWPAAAEQAANALDRGVQSMEVEGKEKMESRERGEGRNGFFAPIREFIYRLNR
uniref:Uncharacterized protein n=1 Tax=Oryza nivara TaxID=4536 RepID=A0A0E0GNV5_ORYNI